MQILLIGAGYVGTAVLESLRDSGHTLYITTTSVNKVNDLKEYSEHVHHVNSLDSDKIQELVDSCDCLILMIAPKNESTYADTYLNTAKIITKLLKNRRKPFHLIYTGSTSVYEGLQSTWVTEEDSLNPFSENAKILFETEIELLKHPETCILRLGGIYGPERTLLNRAKRMSGVEMPDQGNQNTNHIHLEDIVSAISFCLENRMTGVYNLVNDAHPKRNELYDGLCRSADVPTPIWNQHVEGKMGYQVSNTKIQKKGFSFKHPYFF